MTINDFLDVQNKIKGQYENEAQKTIVKSTEFFGEDILNPIELCDSTILFLLYEIADTHSIKKGNVNEIDKMHLATAYLQGIDISTNLILEGNYIKAAATLKQDYEIMIRFNEIHKGKAKDGKTPNAKYGPETFRDFYGYLNNIAHPSKIGVINKILNYQTEDFKQSISFVKQLQKGVAHRLITYNAAIKLEILRHILKAYFDIAGNNENYEKGLKHYLIIEKTYTKIGMFEQR